MPSVEEIINGLREAREGGCGVMFDGTTLDDLWPIDQEEAA